MINNIFKLYWKTLNYQILLKTQHSEPKIRYNALKTIQMWWKKVGEELLVLLPETVPFLSELMEDTNIHVENLCQETILTIESYLGPETISSYL